MDYGPSVEFPLCGSGQGIGGSPTFWAVIADAFFNSIDSYRPGLDLCDPNRTISSHRNEDRYVDNTSLGVDGRDQNVVGRLTEAAQHHERTLYTTCGKLALHKCTWVLLKWAWVDGKAFLNIDQETPVDMESSSKKLMLVQSET